MLLSLSLSCSVEVRALADRNIKEHELTGNTFMVHEHTLLVEERSSQNRLDQALWEKQSDRTVPYASCGILGQDFSRRCTTLLQYNLADP